MKKYTISFSYQMDAKATPIIVTISRRANDYDTCIKNLINEYNINDNKIVLFLYIHIECDTTDANSILENQK